METGELLVMGQREADRLKVIHEVLQGQLKQKQAAKQMELSTRQVKRLCRRVRQEGNRGILHRLRGRGSNHQLRAGLLEKALQLVASRYGDFGPTLANEKLRQIHRLKLSTSVLRQGMMGANIWKARKQKAKHRAWRERRACLGELVQLDGSTHRWFEERGPECVLIAYIDDATSRTLDAEFVESEDTLTLMRTTKTYLMQHGRPVAFYVDQDSIYKINRQATLEEQLQDCQPATQFTRAMGELGIEVISANSPQAKGRVERLFGTLQDRLVKELRLEKISTIAEANQFLRDKFLATHNARFAVPPLNATNAHRPVLKAQALEKILSLRTERTLMNDFTLQFQNLFFQLLAEQPIRLSPKDKVVVETRLDGSIHLRFKDRYLNFKLLESRRRAPMERRSLAVKASKRYKPAATHPWRRPLLLSARSVARQGSLQAIPYEIKNEAC